MPNLKFPKPKHKPKISSRKGLGAVKRPLQGLSRGKKKVSVPARKIKALKNRALALFSQYIRLRDCHRYTPFNDWGKCYTCYGDFKYHQFHAGHYLHGKLDFDERNRHAQCAGCNTFKHGNLSAYALHLIKDYGKGILEELDRAAAEVHKHTPDEYENLIRTYTQKIKELEA